MKNNYLQTVPCADLKMADFLYDTACERLVIGTLIKYTWAYPLAAAQLQEDLFCNPECRSVFTALVALNERRKDFNELELIWEIQKCGSGMDVPELLELSQQGLVSENQFCIHVGHLSDLLSRRRLITLGGMMRERANDAGCDLDETLGKVKAHMDSILTMGTPEGTTSLTDSLSDLQRLISDRQEGKLHDMGTMVGFPQLDNDGGLMPGQLVVIAGASSHGKSALAMSFVKKILEQHLHIAYFSLEMTAIELSSRLLSMESGVASSVQIHPSRKLEQQEFIEVAQALGRLEPVSQYLHFDARFTANIDQICSAIRSMHFRYDLRGVFIDYLQILNSTQTVTNREQFMGEVARRLKNLAVELGIWVVTLSQFNRNDFGEEPTLMSIRDSGQIAEAADRVLLIHRPEANGKGRYAAPFKQVSTHHTALFHLAKNRNGATARFIVDYYPERTLFVAHEGDLPEADLSAELQETECFTFKE